MNILSTHFKNCYEIINCLLKTNTKSSQFRKLYLKFIEATMPFFPIISKDFYISFESYWNTDDERLNFHRQKSYGKKGILLLGETEPDSRNAKSIYLLDNCELVGTRCKNHKYESFTGGSISWISHSWERDVVRLDINKLKSNTLNKCALSLWNKIRRRIDEPPWYLKPNNINDKPNVYPLRHLKTSDTFKEIHNRDKWLNARFNHLRSTDKTAKGPVFAATNDLIEEGSREALNELLEYLIIKKEKDKDPYGLFVYVHDALDNNARSNEMVISLCNERLRKLLGWKEEWEEELEEENNDSSFFSLYSDRCNYVLDIFYGDRFKAIKLTLSLWYEISPTSAILFGSKWLPKMVNSKYVDSLFCISLLEVFNKEKWSQELLIGIWKKRNNIGISYDGYLNEKILKEEIERALGRRLSLIERIF